MGLCITVYIALVLEFGKSSIHVHVTSVTMLFIAPSELMESCSTGSNYCKFWIFGTVGVSIFVMFNFANSLYS